MVAYYKENKEHYWKKSNTICKKQRFMLRVVLVDDCIFVLLNESMDVRHLGWEERMAVPFGTRCCLSHPFSSKDFTRSLLKRVRKSSCSFWARNEMYSQIWWTNRVLCFWTYARLSATWGEDWRPVSCWDECMTFSPPFFRILLPRVFWREYVWTNVLFERMGVCAF